MNQSSGNEINTQNANMVSPGTQSIQSQCDTSRMNNRQSAMNSSNCETEGLRTTQAGPGSTSVTTGTSMANKPSQITESECNLDADSIVQSNLDKSQTPPGGHVMAPGTTAGYTYPIDLFGDYSDFSDEDSADPSEQNVSRSPRFIGQGRKRRRCNSISLDDDKHHCSAMAELSRAKDECLAAKKKVEELEKQIERYQYQELLSHKQRQDLEETNIRLEKGEIPILQDCQRKMAELSGLVDQEWNQTAAFLNCVPDAAMRFCSTATADIIQSGVAVPQGLMDAYNAFLQVEPQCVDEMFGIIGQFYNESQARIDDHYRTNPTNAESIQLSIEKCEDDVRKLSQLRKRRLQVQQRELMLVFQQYFAELQSIKEDDALRRMHHRNIYEDLSGMVSNNCARRGL